MATFTEYDLIQAMSGADENGYGKCVVSIRQQRQNADGVLVDIDEFISEKPVVQVSAPSYGYVLVDLIFNSIEDKDLRIIYNHLSQFFSATNSIDEDSQDYPVLSLSIIPNEFEEKYWALGLNPIFYALTPEDSTGEPTIIRMTFVKQDDQDAIPNFLFLLSPDDAIATLGDEYADEAVVC